MNDSNLPLIQKIPFEGHTVRILGTPADPLFVAADVCAALGLNNATEALRSLDEDDLSSAEVVDNLGRRQRVNVVNESGLYQLIFGSRKPEAKRFKRWVTSEVLPSIRRTGSYTAGADEPWLLRENELLRRMLSDKDRIIALERELMSARAATATAAARAGRKKVNRGARGGKSDAERQRDYYWRKAKGVVTTDPLGVPQSISIVSED